MSEYDDTPTDPRAGAGPRELRMRTMQCMVVPLPSEVLPAGVEPYDADTLFTELADDPEIETRKRFKAPAAAGGLRGGALAPQEVAVVKMPPHRAAALVQDPRVHIERDHHVRVTSPSPDARGSATGVVNPGVQLTAAPVTRVPFLVTDREGRPLPDATVVVMSPEGHFQAVTGPDGLATVNVSVHDLTAISGVYVKPVGDYWERYQDLPALSASDDNTVALRPLTDTFPGLHDREVRGWGFGAMGMDQIPPTYRGQGIKVAVIDSGAATVHPDLTGRVTDGVNLVEGEQSDQWSVDVIGHGTHCAGVTAGADTGTGILGIAPEAEIHICKIFPGGRYSGVIQALNYCIDKKIDVVNLSMGSDEPSALVSQAIEQAREAGIACIAAAGNSGGRVQYPARLPSVLTVAAIGKIGNYPDDTYHAQQIWGQPDPQGYFSTTFTCHGPEVDVCAPGVAILSSVPERSYAAWDGTSMATPHVTGLAALILAHHPDFRDGFRERNVQRVDRLFEIIRSSCTPLYLGDPGRSGAGLPNAPRALSLKTSALTVATPELVQLREAMQNAGLLTATGSEVIGPLEEVRRLLQAAGLLPTG